MPGAVVAVEGPSGAGKSRAVAGAAHRLGAHPLGEAFDRIEPRPSLTWKRPTDLLRLEQQLLREEACRYAEARARAATGTLVLADTGFLGPLMYTRALVELELAPQSILSALLRLAWRLARTGRWGLPDGILYLRSSAADRARRAALDPSGHPRALRGRHEAAGALEEVLFRDLVAPRYGSKFRWIPARGPAADVAAKVARSAGLLGGPGTPPPPIVPMLRALGTLRRRSRTLPTRA